MGIKLDTTVEGENFQSDEGKTTSTGRLKSLHLVQTDERGVIVRR